jgi:LacI family transcriptional regulator
VNAGQVAYQMLSDSGCQFPVVLSEEKLTQAIDRRITQFTEAFTGQGNRQVNRIVARYASEKDAYEAVDAYLRDGGRVDGLFCVHDNLAAGAYLALRQYSLDIPRQVKVVGMGDSDWAAYLQPPLSCAGAEEAEVYDKAAEMILTAFSSPSRNPEIVRTFARIISRGSA